jgi:dolichyl-phosphate-mannose-protein mannosyltransferase
VFHLFGIYTFNSFLAAAALNILFVSLACIPIFYAGRRIAGLGLGAGAAWLWAIFPNGILLTYESMWEACLSALLAAIILWATLELAESERPIDWIGYGLLWGFALMTNPTLLSVLPFLLVWLAWRAHKERHAWLILPTLSLAVALLCCVPWTMRNYSVFHRFVPLRSVLGLQLWLGNNPQAAPPWLGTLHPINDEAERQQYIAMGEINYMREKKSEAIRYMEANPRHVAHLSWLRFVSIWSGGTAYPLKDLRASDSGWFDYVLLFNIFAAIAALTGIILVAARRSIYLVPLAAFPLIFPWAYYLTLALPRYRLPIDPIVMLLAAVAIAGIFRVRFRLPSGRAGVQSNGVDAAYPTS